MKRHENRRTTRGQISRRMVDILEMVEERGRASEQNIFAAMKTTEGKTKERKKRKNEREERKRKEKERISQQS